MRLLPIALCGSLALAACTSINTGKVDDTIRANLPKVCVLISTAHAAFLQIDAAHPLSASIVKKEALAFTASGPVCADPEHVTAANALQVAVNVYAVIVEALAEAKRAGA